MRTEWEDRWQICDKEVVIFNRLGKQWESETNYLFCKVMSSSFFLFLNSFFGLFILKDWLPFSQVTKW